jgi:hypothetical protein
MSHRNAQSSATMKTPHHREQTDKPGTIAPGSRAGERATIQRKNNNRMLRTILLGTVAMIVGVLWLGEQYGVEREETLNLLAASAGFVLTLVAAGLLGAGVIWLVRLLLRKR